MAIDLDELATYVTEALYESIRPEGEGWDDLPSADQENIREGAIVAVKAAMEWFGLKGVQILPPNSFKAPSCREEAEAMMAAGTWPAPFHPPPPAHTGTHSTMQLGVACYR